MAVNKNFVVKNGFEVNTNLIVADATTDKVGIGTTIPQYGFHVIGGIGVTNSYVSGISTITNELRVGSSGQAFSVISGPTGIGKSVGVGTAYPEYLLDIRSPVSTGQTALYVYGDLRVTGDVNIDDIVLDQADINRLFVSQAAQLNSGATLYVTGISTFDGYTDINNSVDISNNLRVSGITTLSSAIVGSAVTINSTGIYVTGVGTVTSSFNVGTALTAASVVVGSAVTINRTGVNITGIITSTTYRVGSAQTINATGINITGISTFSGITTVTGPTLFAKQLDVSGISTLGTVRISSGIITATSGVVTYYGDGSYLRGNARNLTATIGIGTSGGVVGYAVSFIDLRGPGLSTVFYDGTTGIATVNIVGGGGGATIGVGSTPGSAGFPVGFVTSGNLWYNTNIGRLFIYYQDTDSAQWVDAAPFNVGIITAVGSLSFANGTAISPSWYFDNSSTTGVFSPTAGQQTFVSAGSSILNINPAGIRVTGVATATDFDSLSDIRYKENVNTVNSALLKVDQLRGVKFNWKESGLPSYGVIAQELEDVLPELVHGDDPKTVNYNGIIGVLIEAIKELKAEVEELKNTK